MWSVGCIFAELLVGRPLFPGVNEPDQLDRICKIMGLPTETTMPGVSKLPKYAPTAMRFRVVGIQKSLKGTSTFEMRLLHVDGSLQSQYLLFSSQ